MGAGLVYTHGVDVKDFNVGVDRSGVSGRVVSSRCILCNDPARKRYPLCEGHSKPARVQKYQGHWWRGVRDALRGNPACPYTVQNQNPTLAEASKNHVRCWQAGYDHAVSLGVANKVLVGLVPDNWDSHTKFSIHLDKERHKTLKKLKTRMKATSMSDVLRQGLDLLAEQHGL